MRNPMVGDPRQGGTQYPINESSGVATGTGQTAIPSMNYDAHGAYGAYAHDDPYAINQQYVANAAIDVQEMAPGTTPARQSTFVDQYGVLQPHQRGPQQRVGYARQGATAHDQQS